MQYQSIFRVNNMKKSFIALGILGIALFGISADKLLGASSGNRIYSSPSRVYHGPERVYHGPAR